jgi:hypothetical protein
MLFSAQEAAVKQFYPTDNRWLLTVLNMKSISDWRKKGYEVQFALSSDEKLTVSVKMDSMIFDFHRNWRELALTYKDELNRKLLPALHKWASDEFLSVFQPDLDLVWNFYLGDTLYGKIERGKITWKRGIY